MKSEQMSYTDWYHGMAEIKKKMILFFTSFFWDISASERPELKQ